MAVGQAFKYRPVSGLSLCILSGQQKTNVFEGGNIRLLNSKLQCPRAAIWYRVAPSKSITSGYRVILTMVVARVQGRNSLIVRGAYMKITVVCCLFRLQRNAREILLCAIDAVCYYLGL